jgi:SnoaL-like protein
MKTIEIGKKLVELCNKGKQDECMETLYSPDIVSVEAASMPNMPAEMKGLQAVRGKAKWWNENHTVHSSKAEGPFPMGDRFIVKFSFDITSKPMGNKRIQMEEAALYTVKNDKIVREEFFYVTE